MESQTEENMEIKCKLECYRGYIGAYLRIVQGYYPNNGESNGKEHGKLNGTCDNTGQTTQSAVAVGVGSTESGLDHLWPP